MPMAPSTPVEVPPRLTAKQTKKIQPIQISTSALDVPMPGSTDRYDANGMKLGREVSWLDGRSGARHRTSRAELRYDAAGAQISKPWDGIRTVMACSNPMSGCESNTIPRPKR